MPVPKSFGSGILGLRGKIFVHNFSIQIELQVLGSLHSEFIKYVIKCFSRQVVTEWKICYVTAEEKFKRRHTGRIPSIKFLYQRRNWAN